MGYHITVFFKLQKFLDRIHKVREVLLLHWYNDDISIGIPWASAMYPGILLDTGEIEIKMKQHTLKEGKLFIGTAREILSLYRNYRERELADYISSQNGFRWGLNRSSGYGVVDMAIWCAVKS